NPALPWPALGAMLVAFATLLLTGTGFLVLPVLAVALILSRLTGFRLPDRPWVRWMARVPVAALALLSSGTANHPAETFIASQTMGWFGQGCALELVLLCWMERPAGASPAGGAALLSCLVFLAGCHTTDTTHIQYSAPLFLALAAWGFRGFDPAAARRRSGPAAAAVLVLALSVGGLLFAAVRTSRGLLTQWGNDLLLGRGSQLTGMSTAPALGQGEDLRRSFTRTLRLEGAQGVMHLRAMAFDTYDGGAWLPSLGERPFAAVSREALRAELPGKRVRVARLAESLGFLFVPLNCAGLDPGRGRTLSWNPERGGPLRADGEAPPVYDLILAPGAGQSGPFNRPPDAAERRRLLTVSSQIDPRVRSLARRIAGGHTEPEALAGAVERYLPQHHTYSLKNEIREGDPVSTFLLEGRAAHCEYFASAAVVLLRCLGIPARYVTGFYAHEASGPGSMVVRERDAHAWAEAWIDGKGWITVDATPADGLPDHAGSGTPALLRAWEWLQDAGSNLRDQLLERAGILLLLGCAGGAGVFALTRLR
ncbi:MAG TPA: transglutaminaseTgpA domain-containing protein, partial [Armatimonadota bacterium]|nr:transglutaminaseTgpA domain-containing protein [Armatimonadota bacterium]